MHRAWGQRMTCDPAAPDLHHRIIEALKRRYDAPIMDNVQRAAYVECLIAEALGPCWHWTGALDWGLVPWDCEHSPSEARIEIKQAAARQLWDGASPAPPRKPNFDIAPRRWVQSGSHWTELPKPMRAADVYVFAWHSERDREIADHRDASQWQFYVVTESRLPPSQKTISLSALRSLVPACGFTDLLRNVEHSLPARHRLKIALESS